MAEAIMMLDKFLVDTKNEVKNCEEELKEVQERDLGCEKWLQERYKGKIKSLQWSMGRIKEIIDSLNQ